LASIPAAMLVNSLCGATAFALIRLAWELGLAREASKNPQEVPAKSPSTSSESPSAPSSPPKT
jgi:hypothetical protein